MSKGDTDGAPVYFEALKRDTEVSIFSIDQDKWVAECVFVIFSN